MEQNKKSDLLSVNGTARILGIAPQTVRDWSAKGKLIPVRTENGVRLFFREDVEKLRKQQDGSK